jgi:hypothetical protein
LFSSGTNWAFILKPSNATRAVVIVFFMLLNLNVNLLNLKSLIPPKRRGSNGVQTFCLLTSPQPSPKERE